MRADDGRTSKIFFQQSNSAFTNRFGVKARSDFAQYLCKVLRVGWAKLGERDPAVGVDPDLAASVLGAKQPPRM